MSPSEALPAVELQQPLVNVEPESSRWHKVRHALGTLGTVAAFGAIGGAAGLGIALEHPAHVQIADTDTTVRTDTKSYDELDVGGKVAQIKIANKRRVLGQSVGVHVDLNVDFDKFKDENGNVDLRLLPLYFSLFSDTKQEVSDLEWALLKNDLIGIGLGVLIGASPYGAYRGYGRWRSGRNIRDSVTPEDAAKMHAYHAPERTFARRVGVGLVTATVLTAIPSTEPHYHTATRLHIDPYIFATTGQKVEIDGAAGLGVAYAETLYQKFIAETNMYYNQLNANLGDYLKTNPVQLPSGANVVNFGFITDRHCNTGMDRVSIELMKHYSIKLLASAGDDDLNGSFPFESACTSGLAERAKKAGIKMFIGIRGNHDSSETANDEKKQGIQVLDDTVISVDGLNFIGEHDPRNSRWGAPITESAAQQAQETKAQGMRIGAMACSSDKKFIAILHDPRAGQTAIQNGCGNITVAIDGHTHKQAGPTDITLPTGYNGYQFTGGSSGGSGSANEHTSNPLNDITVGPLKHSAFDYIVSIDKQTGALISITTFEYATDQTVAASQQIIDPAYFSTAVLTGPTH